MCAVTVFMSACACLIVTSGFRRPITVNQWKSWFTCSGLNASGTESWLLARSVEPGPNTPTTV